MGIEVLSRFDGICPKCGKIHKFTTDVHTGAGALAQLPGAMDKYQIKNPYVIADNRF